MTKATTEIKSLSMFDTVSGSNIGAEIELQTASGDASGVYVSLLGPDSDASRKAERKVRERHQELLRKRKSIDLEADAIEILASCITGWRNMPEYGTFSFEAAKELLTKYPAIRRQLEQEQADIRNFIKG